MVKCEHPDGCSKHAIGAMRRCKAHGGGTRCQHPGCDKAAQGVKKLCCRHGGGTTCDHVDADGNGCKKHAIGASRKCKAHGGGVRCQHPEGCSKAAQGASKLCCKHGGGVRCQDPSGCNKHAIGSTRRCKAHRLCIDPSAAIATATDAVANATASTTAETSSAEASEPTSVTATTTTEEDMLGLDVTGTVVADVTDSSLRAADSEQLLTSSIATAATMSETMSALAAPSEEAPGQQQEEARPPQDVDVLEVSQHDGDPEPYEPWVG